MTEKTENNGKNERKPSGLWVKYRPDGSPYGVMVVSDFPIEKMREWIKECNIGFSGCRWAKITADHEKAKAFDLLVEERFKVQVQKAPPEVKEEFLIGGETIEK